MSRWKSWLERKTHSGNVAGETSGGTNGETSGNEGGGTIGSANSKMGGGVHIGASDKTGDKMSGEMDGKTIGQAGGWANDRTIGGLKAGAGFGADDGAKSVLDAHQPGYSDFSMRDKQLLLQEIRRAKSDWRVAQKQFDWVTERDQIDYAVYALEASEKKYEMLLRRAKRMQLTSDDVKFIWGKDRDRGMG